MKSEWSIKMISDIAEINPHESLKRGMMAKKIPMDALQPFTRDILSFQYEEYKGGTKFRNKDTIMARITPCLENGKIAQVGCLNDNEVGFGSTEYIVFRAREGTDPDFLYYLLCSPFVREPSIKSMVGSSGRQRVQTNVVANLPIAVPKIAEQEKIGHLLKALDDKIRINKEINKNLQLQAQAIYTHMIIDEADESWHQGLLSDVATITMGQSPKGDTYNEVGTGSVFFQGRAEFGFRFPTRRLYTIDPKRMAKASDVLMSVRAPVGDLNVAYEDCCIGRGLAAIRSQDNHQSFVLYTMLALRDQLDVFNGEGTVFGSINRESLNNMPIIIPPCKIIDNFESIVSPMDAAIRNNYEESCHLQAIRDRMLPRLMSGKLDASVIDL